MNVRLATRAIASSRPILGSTTGSVRADWHWPPRTPTGGPWSRARTRRATSRPSSTNGSPHYVGDVTDVFDCLIGQDRAVKAMRQYARHPVHAYLFSGPVGSSLLDTVVSFAAGLQCPRHGCGSRETCRLGLSGNRSEERRVGQA